MGVCVCVSVMRKGRVSHLNHIEMECDDTDCEGPLWLQQHGWGLVTDVKGNLRWTCQWERRECRAIFFFLLGWGQVRWVKYMYAIHKVVF